MALTKVKRERRNGHRNGHMLTPAMTRAKQREFLEVLAREGNAYRAAEVVGINPTAAYKWSWKSEAFAQKMQEAQIKGEQMLLGKIERIIDKRIEVGQPDPQSAVLTMFRTKRLDPRYRDNVSVNVAAAGPVAIMIGVDTPLDVVGKESGQEAQDVVDVSGTAQLRAK